MGRGGGGGGSSRSSGGGGSSRSFGGSSSRSSRGGGSSFSRGGSSFSSSSYRPSGPRVTHHHHHYGGYGYGGYRNTVYIGGTAGRVIGWITVLFVVMVMLFVFGGVSSGGSVTKSTVEREALKPYASFDKNAVDDDAGWIHDKKTLLKGMQSFYKQTGVQPALVVCTDINGEKYVRDSVVEDFMNQEYDDLIGHERGLLLLFAEYADSDYYVYYMAGEDAQTVMDDEACDILMDYVHSLYTNSSLSDEEFFAQAFEKTADRIMSVTPTMASRVPVIVIGVLVIAGFVFVFKMVKQKHKREAERAQETERILNTPIDRI